MCRKHLKRHISQRSAPRLREKSLFNTGITTRPRQCTIATRTGYLRQRTCAAPPRERPWRHYRFTRVGAEQLSLVDNHSTAHAVTTADSEISPVGLPRSVDATYPILSNSQCCFAPFTGGPAAHHDNSERNMGKTLPFAIANRASTTQLRRRVPRYTGACVKISPPRGPPATDCDNPTELQPWSERSERRCAMVSAQDQAKAPRDAWRWRSQTWVFRAPLLCLHRMCACM